MTDMQWKCPYCGNINQAPDSVVDFIAIAEDGEDAHDAKCNMCGKQSTLYFEVKSIKYYITEVDKDD